MSAPTGPDSVRKVQLLEASYEYACVHGLVDLSLRPLADAVGSSPRVLLYLFGSKDGLVQALLARARSDELELLSSFDAGRPGRLAEVGELVWRWLAAPERRGLLALWIEGYARSLIDTSGPWVRFAEATVQDWLVLFTAAQPARSRRTKGAIAERTLLLAVLRGALLDLLATGDMDRTSAAVVAHLNALRSATS